MKLNDLKIGTQLILGMCAGVLSALLLGVLAWVQMDAQWNQTKGLYEHPYAVRQAIGDLEVVQKEMILQVRNLLLAKSKTESMAALQAIDVARNPIDPLFALLKERYLGPHDDITALQGDFVKWNTLRDETIRLFLEGRKGDADASIRPGAALILQAKIVENHLQKIDDFARNKATSFYQTAAEKNDALKVQLAIALTVIFLLSVLVTGILLQMIKVPLKELSEVTEKFRQGDLGVRSHYVSNNEFGMLSTAFNAMADAIQAQAQISENATRLADIMLREDEVHAFCHELLKALLLHTGSQIGAIYFLNEEKTAYEHFDSIGLSAGGHASFSATDLEGELGAALAAHQIQRITDIPADTRFVFAAASGVFTPREILTIPILSDQTAVAVISLASVHAYDKNAIRLIDDIWSVLTARINGILAFRKLQDLAQRLDIKNRELDEQKRELSAQAGELTEQNTELEMQKRQLDEANRLKSAFLSNMSHELRTPLNSVIALSGVLNRRLANTIPPEEFAYLEIIERNGKNLLLLINDILDLSRIEAGFEEISVSRFDFRELADEIVAMLEPLVLEKNIALLGEIPDDLPPISSDWVKCRHILQNLVGNAVKFTERGQVTLSARYVDNEIQVAVTDTGIGIAAEHLPYIFDEFRQADDSASRKYGGTGLGLAIAKKYARLLGGSITVVSAVGQGSTFTLRIPLLQELPNAAQTSQVPHLSIEQSTPAPLGHGQSILVVEDGEPAIIQLTDILTRQGYRLQIARNGKEALEQIERAVPDAMILDLMMPEVDGFQVLQAVRGQLLTAHLPVLILTAKHVTKDELSFLKGNNVHQLIQKGDINKDGLLAAVARMVAPRQQAVASASPSHCQPMSPDKPLVLIVEDNRDSRRTACAVLNDNYRVIEAVNGLSGVEQARARQPDIILMDIAMPVMDGIEALQEIRKDETLRHIPVIAVTASAMRGDRETILAHGFDGYISKPIDAVLLKKTLHQALD